MQIHVFFVNFLQIDRAQMSLLDVMDSVVARVEQTCLYIQHPESKQHVCHWRQRAGPSEKRGKGEADG